MFGKRARPWEDSGPPDQRLRHNVASMFLTNEISSVRTQSVFQDADASGAQHVGDLAKVGRNGRLGKNLARDLKRKLLKESAWPKPYVVQVRTWNAKRNREELRDVPVLLPHEIIFAIAEDRSHRQPQNPTRTNNIPNKVTVACLLVNTFKDKPTAEHLLRQRLGAQDRGHLKRGCEDVGADLSRSVGLGLWADGVPYNYDRSRSLDVFSLNVVGFSDPPFRDMRIPLVALDHSHVLKGQTFDDLLEVLAWSFVCLGVGRFPTRRHDNSEFHPGSDQVRFRKGGSAVGFHGFLVECRGDWKMFKDVFRFPQFNELSGICWLCNCTPHTWRCVDDAAPWRQNRLDHGAFLDRLRLKGVEPSPIFGSPGFRSSCFKPDWLHVVDLGVACDFLGNFLLLLSRRFPGAVHKTRVGSMWEDIQQWYQVNEVENRLDNLYPSMIQANARSPPKLRAKAAQARALVPYAAFAAHRLEVNKVGVLATAMAVELAACYAGLSALAFEHAQLAFHSRRFCLAAVRMEAEHNGVLWRCKPKMHLFQELCEYHVDSPATFWTYRDEDFGGSMAQLARVRGGPRNPEIGRAHV